MAVKYADVVVWVVVDDAGDYAAGTTPERAVEDYGALIGDVDATERGYRRVKLTVRVPLPTDIELAGAVEVEESQAGLVVG